MDDRERQLVSRCLAGDAPAQEALYRLHAGRILAHFLRSGFARADAEDLLQETFVRAFRSLRTFDAARGSLGTWLAAIARNVARKRWHRRREAESFDPELAEEMLAAPDNPGREAERREETDAVAGCVAALPDELERIVRLRYVEGRTTRGIATAAGMPESTVRLRLAEAHERLARCLRGKGVTA